VHILDASCIDSSVVMKHSFVKLDELVTVEIDAVFKMKGHL